MADGDFLVFKDVEEVDVFFEGLLIFIHPSEKPEIDYSSMDNGIEVGMNPKFIDDLEDGDHIDNLPAGEAVRQLLKV